MSKFFFEHELRVITVRDGREALSAAEQYRPDIFLLDPRLSGRAW
jgi:DNA-binding response OmpR family regulator